MAVRLSAALKIVIFFVFLGGAGMGYVWQKKQIFELGQELGEQQDELKNLLRDIRFLEEKKARLRSNAFLLNAIRQHGLNLVMPRPEQIMTLTNITGSQLHALVVPNSEGTQLVSRHGRGAGP